MSHPIWQWSMHFISTKHSISTLGLNRLSAVVESQQLLQVRLYNAETGVDGRIAKSMRQETEVGEARVGVVGVIRLMLLGPPTAFSIACSSEMTSLGEEMRGGVRDCEREGVREV